MANFNSNSDKMLTELKEILARIDTRTIDSATQLIVDSNRIFFLGIGRSSLVSRCFAMRLAHMGFYVCVVGETAVPAITQGDLLIVCSASGKARSIWSVANRARDVGANMLLISANNQSPLTDLANTLISIPVQLEGKIDYEISTIFEETAFLVFESIVPMVMELKGVSYIDMARNHTNIEYW